MQQTAVINGIMSSWANISLILFGTIVRGVKGVKYNYKQDKKNVYGWGCEPIGRTYGNVEYNAEIVLLRDELQNIISGLRANGLNKITDLAPFNIPVIYGQNPAGGLNPAPQGQYQDTLMYCEFLDFNFDAKQNDQEFDMTLPLIVGGMRHF